MSLGHNFWVETPQMVKEKGPVVRLGSPICVSRGSQTARPSSGSSCGGVAGNEQRTSLHRDHKTLANPRKYLKNDSKKYLYIIYVSGRWRIKCWTNLPKHQENKSLASCTSRGGGIAAKDQDRNRTTFMGRAFMAISAVKFL